MRESMEIGANLAGTVPQFQHAFAGLNGRMTHYLCTSLQINRQDRQSLIEVVMEFACKPAALLLLRIDQLITLTTASMSSIKMDVKKKSASTGVESRSRDPAHCSFTSLDWFGLLSILVSFSADGDDAIEFERAASELVASEATMVLSEARGLWLFLVIREGITCNG